MEEKLLVIVDMQNDFITGSLANKDAEAIVPDICKLIKEWKGDIICTQDTHEDNYLASAEGEKLPVKHCIRQTNGWLVCPEIREALSEKRNVVYLAKDTFGSRSLVNHIQYENYDEIVFVGTCTDICVISNVLTVKTYNPETPITVYADLCAGVTKEKHEAALKVMDSCQIDIKYFTEGK